MASLTFEDNGHARIQFKASNGKRQTLRLGRVKKKDARSIKVHVEDLVSASISGSSPTPTTARWVKDLSKSLHDKLVRVGLLTSRKSATLGDFMKQYIAERTDVKPATLEAYAQAERNLLACFGPDKGLRDIIREDAKRYRRHLIDVEKLSENTARRRMGMAKQFLTAAVNDRLVDDNPFNGEAAAVRDNADRYYFVSRDEAKKLLDACIDAEWRLLVALSRYGGLRCPSEHLALRWIDIDWAKGRIHVSSPKTEHHHGKASRIVPIFPELEPYLRECFEAAEDGAEFVITRYRSARANLRTQLSRTIRQAGLNPWPKLWQNLRSTRQTELAESFPGHVVCAWMGNSEAVARKHYLQVTDAHFEEATYNPTSSATEISRNASQAENSIFRNSRNDKDLRLIANHDESARLAYQDSNLEPSEPESDVLPIAP